MPKAMISGSKWHQTSTLVELGLTPAISTGSNHPVCLSYGCNHGVSIEVPFIYNIISIL